MLRSIGFDQRELLLSYKFNCTAGNGKVVPLLSALDGKFAGPAARTRTAPPALAVSVASPSRAGGGGGGAGGGGSGGGGSSNAGKIAGEWEYGEGRASYAEWSAHDVLLDPRL